MFFIKNSQQKNKQKNNKQTAIQIYLKKAIEVFIIFILMYIGCHQTYKQ